MIDNSILAQIKLISSDGFKQLCEKIIIGLGFEHASEFSVSDMPVAFQETIERKSADNMFLTKETWSLAFTRPDVQPVDRGLKLLCRQLK